ncbi:hypothetical protein RIF29_00345 [Crotalaria pallida]|uniref:Uncharacterized protein n=1 Tax=Crotalaria pallida TaxID=3830 RepID=A0AAN9IVS1_CROPI
MAKKKGKKASSSPSSSGKRKEQHKPNDDSIDMEELQLLENPDLSKLSPMQAEKVLKVIEDLKHKIQNKVASDACEEQPEIDAEKASRSNTDLGSNSEQTIVRPNWLNQSRAEARISRPLTTEHFALPVSFRVGASKDLITEVLS